MKQRGPSNVWRTWWNHCVWRLWRIQESCCLPFTQHCPTVAFESRSSQLVFVLWGWHQWSKTSNHLVLSSVSCQVSLTHVKTDKMGARYALNFLLMPVSLGDHSVLWSSTNNVLAQSTPSLTSSLARPFGWTTERWYLNWCITSKLSFWIIDRVCCILRGSEKP